MNTPGQLNPTAPEMLSRDGYSAGVRITVAGMLVNILLIAVKLAGGVAGRSAAMIADGFHSLSDVLTDVGVLIGLRFMRKPADSDHAYGHGRIETLITLGIGILILLTGLGILRNAGLAVYKAFQGMFPEKPGVIALGAGILSILSKEAVFRLTRLTARKTGSTSLEANAWHHRSDALSSVGAVIGIGGALVLGNRWTILDPTAAGVVALLVCHVGIDIGWRSFRELTDESLSRSTRKRVGDTISNVEGVQDYHQLRTRSLGRYVTIDAHVLVNPDLTVREGHAIATNVEDAIRGELDNAAFITIHIEPHT